MAAAVTCTPSAPISKVSLCHIAATGVASNDVAGYTLTPTPTQALGGLTEAEIRYYFKAHKTGQDSLKSHVFSSSQDGKAVWDSIVFPASGTWTLDLCKNSDDSVVATAAISVS